MKKIFGFILVVLLMACGAAKVDQDVTLHQRPVYKKGENRKPIVNSSRAIDEKEGQEDRQKEQEDKTEEEQVMTTVEAAPLKGEQVTAMPASKIGGGMANAEDIGEMMTFLTSDALKGRDAGSEGIEKAAQYIESIFKDNGVKPYFNSYRDELSNYDNAFNLVGFVEGIDPTLKNEFIVIGAHYDHIGIIKAENGDDIANGANDNASGTATVLELARYFANNKSNKRSIIFALFTAEEKGLLGSKHLAKKLKSENLNLYVMLNYEMVGVPLVGKDYLMYVTGFEESNLAGVCNMFMGRNLVGYFPGAKDRNLFKRSDNYPFYSEFNVPSQTFCTFDFTNFKHYHKVGDEVQLIDFKHMANIVNRSIPMIEDIANSLKQMIKLN